MRMIWKGCGRKHLLSILRHSSGIFLVLNLKFSDYEAGVMTAQL